MGEHVYQDLLGVYEQLGKLQEQARALDGRITLLATDLAQLRRQLWYLVVTTLVGPGAAALMTHLLAGHP